MNPDLAGRFYEQDWILCLELSIYFIYKFPTPQLPFMHLLVPSSTPSPP